ncbi:unnamed protein product [Leptidea sinapis]|uniref:Uncharacterized protein n=1 Tax=Leptidea sinapis TaxID=189913 RepID=A0A5E4PRL7_9NEOP|nr:unnamed protein product [Leptidea sinapis]
MDQRRLMTGYGQAGRSRYNINVSKHPLFIRDFSLNSLECSCIMLGPVVGSISINMKSNFYDSLERSK